MPSHSHTIERENDRSDWYLEWNDNQFVLTNPGRMRLLDIKTSEAHRHIDRKMLVRKGVPCLTTPRNGVMKFKPNDSLVRELKELVVAGLRNDKQYYSEQRSGPAMMFAIGLAIAGISALAFLIALGSMAMPADVAEAASSGASNLLTMAIAALSLIGVVVGLIVAWRAWPMLRDVVKVALERKQQPAQSEKPAKPAKPAKA